MFTDIKNKLDEENFQRIFAACVFDNSPEGVARKLNEYRENNLREMYGWFVNNILVGICGFQVYNDFVEICHIAVYENLRGCGIGSAMVNALAKKYRITVIAETDDDAVDFYRKCGFKTTAFEKFSIRRWKGELVLNEEIFESDK